MVIRGTKRQTVRSRRKRGFAKKGDTLYLYYGLRTKWCTKLREVKCKEVGTILIRKDGDMFVWSWRLTDEEVQNVYTRDGVCGPAGSEFFLLTDYYKDRFAWLDGFRPKGSSLKNPRGAHAMMMDFWKDTHQLPFIGDLIYW